MQVILAVALTAIFFTLLGAVGFAFLVYRYIWQKTLQGMPVQVTIPDSRPGRTVTYNVDPRGTWTRLTEKFTRKRE